jgi:hypothetical protein
LLYWFNALNACERKLFSILRKAGKASFYWDTDPWYIDNTWHEAGFFLRKNREEFPSPMISLRIRNLQNPDRMYR